MFVFIVAHKFFFLFFKTASNSKVKELPKNFKLSCDCCMFSL